MPTLRTVTDAATFAAALAVSLAGDTISCAAGPYGVVTSSRQFAAPGLKVISTIPASPAVFTKLSLDNSSGWSLEDLKIVAPYQAGFDNTDGAIRCWYTDRTSILRCEVVNGNKPSGGFQYGSGIYCLFATNLTVQDCKIYTVNIAINMSGVTGISIMRNEIYDVGVDGIDLFEVQDGTVGGNYIHDFRTDYYSGSHNDFIQVASAVGEPIPRNLAIVDNILDIGNGSWVQAILSQSEGFSAGGDAYRLSGMVYSRNWIRNSFLYGIKAGIATSFVCEDNVIGWVQANTSEPYNILTTAANDHQGFSSTQSVPLILVEGASNPSIVRNNTFYGAPFHTIGRIDWADEPYSGSVSEATLIARGWTISNNVVNRNSPMPARPAFVTNFGGGSGGGGGGGGGTAKTAAGRLLHGNGKTITQRRL